MQLRAVIVRAAGGPIAVGTVGVPWAEARRRVVETLL